MISVIIPAYNEGKNLEMIIPRIKHVIESIIMEYEVLIVDTMTPTDNTKEICEENGVNYIPREIDNSYGSAYRTGLKYAKGDLIVIMDADGSHNPKDIRRFYKVMKNPKVDLVIGSRYCRGGQTHNGFILRMMSKVLNYSYKIMFRLKVKDVSDSYRMYRANQIKSLELECDNFDIVEEVIIKLDLYKKPYNIVEVPIRFNKRKKGKSKRNLIKFIFSYITTMRRLMKIRRNYIKNSKKKI